MEEKRKGRQSLQVAMQEAQAELLVKLHSGPPMRSIENAPPKKQPCPLCNDLGWLRQDLPVTHPDFGKHIRCSCRAADDSERLRAVTGLTPGELKATFEDIHLGSDRADTKAMVESCRQFLMSPGGIFTVWGASGNGKSMILPAAMNEVLRCGIPAAYVVAFDLINYIRQSYTEKGLDVRDQDAYSRLLRFERVPFLALDEVDKIFPLSYWEAKQVTDLIDKRYRWGMEEGMWTIITMNRSPFELFDEFPHILSRLKDGRNVIIENRDEDMRPGMRRV